MELEETIKNLCQALKEEADAVISYTDKIAAAKNTEGAEGSMQVMEAIMLDEVEHIQNICLELTRLVTAGSEEPHGEEGEV